jgi:hypothetical protein
MNANPASRSRVLPDTPASPGGARARHPRLPGKHRGHPADHRPGAPGKHRRQDDPSLPAGGATGTARDLAR